MMNIAYYWVMGICIGVGIGSLASPPVALAASLVGASMGLLSIGWYGAKILLDIEGGK